MSKYVQIEQLKYYFDVSNSYVIKKLMLLSFPYKNKVILYILIVKNWTRIIAREGQVGGYLSPRDDINAPDLYIPLMSFVTYILLISVLMFNTSSKFSPDVFGLTSSSALFALIVEVLISKLGFYVMNVKNVSFLDTFAYCGYQFIG